MFAVKSLYTRVHLHALTISTLVMYDRYLVLHGSGWGESRGRRIVQRRVDCAGVGGHEGLRIEAKGLQVCN